MAKGMITLITVMLLCHLALVAFENGTYMHTYIHAHTCEHTYNASTHTSIDNGQTQKLADGSRNQLYTECIQHRR